MNILIRIFTFLAYHLLCLSIICACKKTSNKKSYKSHISGKSTEQTINDTNKTINKKKEINTKDKKINENKNFDTDSNQKQPLYEEDKKSLDSIIKNKKIINKLGYDENKIISVREAVIQSLKGKYNTKTKKYTNRPLTTVIRYLIMICRVSPIKFINKDTGDNPYHMAIKYFNYSLLEYLIKNDEIFDKKQKPKDRLINMKNKQHKTPLHLAASIKIVTDKTLSKHSKYKAINTRFNILNSIIKNYNASFSIQDNEKNTFIHVLCIYMLHMPKKRYKIKLMDCIKECIKDGRTKFNIKNNNGDTFIHILFKHLYLEDKTILDLLKFGQRDKIKFYNIGNNKGLTPLMIASKNKNTRLIKLTLCNYQNININLQDKEGKTLFHYIILNQNYKLMKLFLKYPGIDINFQTNTAKNTPLHYLVKTVIRTFDLPYIVQFFEVIDKLKIYLNLNILNYKNMTPMVFGLNHALDEVPKENISVKKLYYIRDPQQSILKYNFNNTIYNVCNQLLNKGADPNLADQDGNTPLMYAIRLQNCSLVFRLLRIKHIKLLEKNNKGETALSIAEKFWKIDDDNNIYMTLKTKIEQIKC